MTDVLRSKLLLNHFIKFTVVRVLGLAVLGKLLITLIAFISETKRVALNYFCSLKRKTEI